MSMPADILIPTAVDDQVVATLIPLGTLPSTLRTSLVERAMVYDLVPGGRLDGGEHELADTLFLVEGSVSLLIPELPPQTLSAGVGAGRFALAGLANQGAWLETDGGCRLLQVDRTHLAGLLICLASGDAITDQPWLPRLLATEPFSHLPPSGLYHLAEQMQRVEIGADEYAVRQDETAEYYYVLASGECAIEWRPNDSGEPVTLSRLQPGDSFGEEALVADIPRTASVRTLTPCTLLRLTRNQIDLLMRQPSIPHSDRADAERRIGEGAYWLDVRLPAEHAHHSPEGSINVPLGALRAALPSLAVDTEWILCCNTGRRSAAAATVLAEHGFNVRILDGGLHRREIGSDDTLPMDELQRRRVRADEALETALREAASAEAAVVVSTESSPQPQALQPPAELREAAERARTRLEEALREKLDLDKQARNLEAEMRVRQQRARASCARLRNETERRLHSERERLSSEASVAAEAMQALRADRKRAEAQFAEEQRALNERMQRARQELEAQARQIRDEMQRTRQATEDNLQRIRTEHGAAERELVRDAENRLRNERNRMQTEFTRCVRAEAEARAELEAAEQAGREALRVAELERARLRAENERRQARRIEAMQAEQMRLAEATRSAEQRMADAERLSAETLARREDLIRTVNQFEASDPATRDDHEAQALKAELAVYDSRAAEAGRELEQARDQFASAAQERVIVETRDACQAATEEALRLQLYEELEVALAAEQHSPTALGTGRGANPALHDPLAMGDDRDAPLPENLLADIQLQLQDNAAGDELRAAIVAERRQLTESARAQASQDKERARTALEQARRHLRDLKAAALRPK